MIDAGVLGWHAVWLIVHRSANRKNRLGGYRSCMQKESSPYFGAIDNHTD